MASPCIHCSDCAIVCPADLQPQFLHASLNAKNFEQTEKLNLEACLLCNACTNVCPSQIDLRGQFEMGLEMLKQIKINRQKSAEAKLRFEVRESRLMKQTELLAAKRAEKLKNIGQSSDA